MTMTKERLIELVNDKTVNFLFEKFQLLFSEWPAIYVLNSCPLELRSWFIENCHKDNLGLYYFPDETTFAMFLFKFPGVIPSNLWFEPSDNNDNE